MLSKNKGDSNSCKNDGWDDLIQGEFFFGRKILEKKLPGGKNLGERWGQAKDTPFIAIGSQMQSTRSKITMCYAGWALGRQHLIALPTMNGEFKSQCTVLNR